MGNKEVFSINPLKSNVPVLYPLKTSGFFIISENIREHRTSMGQLCLIFEAEFQTITVHYCLII